MMDEQKTEIELKPCPWCGKPPALVSIEASNRSSKYYYACISACPVKPFSAPSCPSPEEARHCWNTRPVEDALVAEVERLRAAITNIQELASGPSSRPEDAWRNLLRLNQIVGAAYIALKGGE